MSFIFPAKMLAGNMFILIHICRYSSQRPWHDLRIPFSHFLAGFEREPPLFEVNVLMYAPRCQGCKIFLGSTYQNGKMYQLTQYIPNGHKIYQLFHSNALPNLRIFLIFGMKIYHLATLLPVMAAEA
jgi:hypothetical protein